MTLLLKHWKLALFVILLIALGIQTQRAENLKAGKIEAEKARMEVLKIANGQSEKTTFYINAYRNQVAKVKHTELAAKNALELQKFEYLKQFENLKRDYRNLLSTSETNMHISGDSIVRITKYLPCKDSIKAFDFVLIDDYNNIVMTVLDSPRLEIRVPLYSVDYWERKKILGLKIGRKQWFREITSPNKLVKIDSIVNYSIRKR